MGVYTYKTTPSQTAVILVERPDGTRETVPVSVYSFAFKCWRFDEDERIAKRVIGPAIRAFERRGTKPCAEGISVYEGRLNVGDPVFATYGNVDLIEPGEGKRTGKVLARVSGPVKVLPAPVRNNP
jgi:hypothetical protein